MKKGVEEEEEEEESVMAWAVYSVLYNDLSSAP